MIYRFSETKENGMTMYQILRIASAGLATLVGAALIGRLWLVALGAGGLGGGGELGECSSWSCLLTPRTGSDWLPATQPRLNNPRVYARLFYRYHAGLRGSRCNGAVCAL